MPYPSKPALLGGDAVFSPPLPMASPKLPDPDSLLPSFRAMLESGHLTKGPELERFEREAAAYLGVGYCLGVSSCTSGLMLCLQALARRRNGVGGLIAVPSFTFLASITAIVWAGFEPLFVEVDPETMNVCPSDLERALAEHEVAGVLPVHVFGNPVPVEPLQEICARAGAALLFDAAHGFGSIHRGIKVGGGGLAQVFSLTPTKMVVAGEGGLVCTDDEGLAEELRVAREYGNDGSYDTVFAGLNARLSEMHACLARGSLAMLEDVVRHRNQVAALLQEALSRIPGIGFQRITAESRTTYKDFTVTIDETKFGMSRDAAAEALLAEGIPTRKYFSPPCHQHRAFARYARRPLPRTEALSARCLSLPLLEPETVDGIAEALGKLHHHAEALQGG